MHGKKANDERTDDDGGRKKKVEIEAGEKQLLFIRNALNFVMSFYILTDLI